MGDLLLRGQLEVHFLGPESGEEVWLHLADDLKQRLRDRGFVIGSSHYACTSRPLESAEWLSTRGWREGRDRRWRKDGVGGAFSEEHAVQRERLLGAG